MARLLSLTAKTGERGDASYRIRCCSVFRDSNRLAVPSSRNGYYISCAKLLVVPTYNIATLTGYCVQSVLWTPRYLIAELDQNSGGKIIRSDIASVVQTEAKCYSIAGCN